MKDFFDPETLSVLSMLIDGAGQQKHLTEDQSNARSNARRLQQLVFNTTERLEGFEQSFRSSPEVAFTDTIVQTIAWHSHLTFALRRFIQAVQEDNVSNSLAEKLERATNLTVSAMLRDSHSKFLHLEFNNSTSTARNALSEQRIRVASQVTETFTR